MGKYLFFDIETHGIEKRWDMEPQDYFRLGQYSWDDGEVVLTTDYNELLDQIKKAPYVVGHNIHSFDLSVLFGKDSLEPLKMAQDRRVIDTMVLATLLAPAPYMFRMANGRVVKDANHPGQAMLWYGLDNLCHQNRLQGKFGDLRELVKKYNPPKTLNKDLDFGLVPVEDPEFREYARQDVVAVRALFNHLMRTQEEVQYPSEYLWREQELHAVLAQMARNGIRPDKELARRKSEAQQNTIDDTMRWLQDEFDFPTEGKAPWKSNAGKAAILKALAAFGVTPAHEDWERTATGNPSFSGDTMIAVTKGTPAEKLGSALAQLQGIRSMPDLVLGSIRGDGRMHPDYSAFQKSGRFCLPETHKIVTRRGVLHIDDVVPGDETLDVRNRWVPIKKVFRYESAEVVTWEHNSAWIQSTPEHRWVQRTENGIDREVSPIDLSKRRVLQLAPDSYPFDPREVYFWDQMTERERTAAIVGFLVTDGHAADRKDTSGSRFRVYQTENKYFQEIREFLGGLIQGESSRSMVGNEKNLMWEFRLYTQDVEAMLEGEGLDWRGGLRHSDTLLPWIMSLTAQECMAFMTAAYMSDGNMNPKVTREISTINPNMIPVFQWAGFRCGWRSNYRKYQSPQNPDLFSGRVAYPRSRLGVRNLKETSREEMPVWCVETESGTFTAWAPEGRWSAPYITGNSVYNPSVLIFNREHKDMLLADEGCYTVELDFSNADARAVAAMSGDEEFAKRFEVNPDGSAKYDGHNLSGEVFFGYDLYHADCGDDCGKGCKPPLRPAAKAATLALGYNVGPRKLADLLNKAAKAEGLDITFWCSEDSYWQYKKAREAEGLDAWPEGEWLQSIRVEGAIHTRELVRNYNLEYAEVKAWKDRVVFEGDSQGFVTNSWGRRMNIDFAGNKWDAPEGQRSRSYNQSPALLGQSTTRELMADFLIRMSRKGEKWARSPRGVIHDAAVVDLPKETIKDDVKVVQGLMQAEYDPQTRTGMAIDFPAGIGPLDGTNWLEGSH